MKTIITCDWPCNRFCVVNYGALVHQIRVPGRTFLCICCTNVILCSSSIPLVLLYVFCNKCLDRVHLRYKQFIKPVLIVCYTWVQLIFSFILYGNYFDGLLKKFPVVFVTTNSYILSVEAASISNDHIATSNLETFFIITNRCMISL